MLELIEWCKAYSNSTPTSEPRRTTLADLLAGQDWLAGSSTTPPPISKKFGLYQVCQVLLTPYWLTPFRDAF